MDLFYRLLVHHRYIRSIFWIIINYLYLFYFILYLRERCKIHLCNLPLLCCQNTPLNALPNVCKKVAKKLQKIFLATLGTNHISKPHLWELEFSKNLFSSFVESPKRVFCKKGAKILQKIFLATLDSNRLWKPVLWELEFFKNLLSLQGPVFCDFRVLEGQRVYKVL